MKLLLLVIGLMASGCSGHKKYALKQLDDLQTEYGNWQRRVHASDCSYMFSTMLRRKRLEILTGEK